jgi:hypothetical protein
VEYEERCRAYTDLPQLHGTFYKKEVLRAVLKNGEVNTRELSIIMARQLNPNFSLFKFNNACGVINDYITTGGENCFNGSLPEIH